MSPRRLWLGWCLMLVGIAGFGFATWRFATIPDLEIRPESLVVRSDQACAIEPEGTVVCWGEMVDSEAESAREFSIWGREGAIRVADIDDATALASQEFSTCALRETGQVACWGRLRDAFADELQGVETEPDWGTFYSQKAIPVVDLSGVREIASSRYEVCALRDTGTITCISGDHGRSDIEPSDAFTPAGELIAVDGSVCAIDVMERVMCVPLTTGGAPEVLVSEADWLSGVDGRVSGDLACGGIHGGAPTCWASNGDGDRVVQVLSSMVGVEDLFQRFVTVCGVEAGGVRCIENTSLPRSVDFDIASLPSQPLPGIDDVVVAGSGGFRSCASLTDGRVQCWGNAGRFETLGDADNTQSSADPVFVGAWGVSQRIRWVWQGAFLLPLVIGVLLLMHRRQPPPPAADTEPIAP